jgi:uncharacterized protein YcbX
MRVSSLYRYPVKGLSPERLVEARLEAGAYFPGDRLFAVENGPSGFDAGAPVHHPKIKFLMLMRNESLARLSTRYDDASNSLLIAQGGRKVLRADLGRREGRLVVEAFLRRFMPGELRGAPKVLAAPPGFRFTDSRRGFVSLINLASVRDLEARLGMPVDPLRFRGNLYLDGLDPWVEFDFVDQVLAVRSGLRLKATKRIERCAATDVDPATGVRDLKIPQALMRHYGHADCGVYAEVVVGGTLAQGDRLTIVRGDPSPHAEDRGPLRSVRTESSV